MRLYHLHITSNLHNVEEFREAGFPHVAPHGARRERGLPGPGAHPEAERQRSARRSASSATGSRPRSARCGASCAAGLDLKIYGGGWQRRIPAARSARAVQGRLVLGLEYMRAILSFDVNIGIVSKWNRNHTASRTFQIPALGAFLLHERNEVVSNLFREGVEAEFFGSDDELLEKCRHYLAHPDERSAIAQAGRRRCLESGYFETDRVREVVPLLESLLAAARWAAARDSRPNRRGSARRAAGSRGTTRASRAAWRSPRRAPRAAGSRRSRTRPL